MANLFVLNECGYKILICHFAKYVNYSLKSKSLKITSILLKHVKCLFSMSIVIILVHLIVCLHTSETSDITRRHNFQHTP